MVRFIKSFRNYTPKDVAGFSKQHEAWLISNGIAIKVEEKKEVKVDVKPEPAKGETGKAGDKTNNGGTAKS